MLFDERPEVRRVEKLYLGFLGCLLAYLGLWFLAFLVAAGLVVLLVLFLVL